MKRKMVSIYFDGLARVTARFSKVIVDFTTDGSGQPGLKVRFSKNHANPIRNVELSYPFEEIRGMQFDGPNKEHVFLLFVDAENPQANPPATARIVYPIPSAVRSWAENAKADEVLEDVHLYARDLEFDPNLHPRVTF